jgi:hypothetical protein
VASNIRHLTRIRRLTGRDGRTLKQPMARQVYFAKMTDADKKGHPPF